MVEATLAEVNPHFVFLFFDLVKKYFDGQSVAFVLLILL